jgi:hypothetical protein
MQPLAATANLTRIATQGDQYDVPAGITQDADPNAELFVPAIAADLAEQATLTRARRYNAHNQLDACPARCERLPTSLQKNILAVNSEF